MKTKKVLLAGLLVNIMNVAGAQDKSDLNSPPTGYFELGVGLTQPMGHFANEMGTSYGTYALPGNDFSLSFGVPIDHSYFGVAFMYSYYYNAYDINTYVDNIQVSDQTNSYYPLRRDGYSENMIMGGLYVTIPAKRLSLDFRVLGGVALCALPEVDYGAEATSLTATNDFEWDTYHSNSSAFAFDVGGGLRYRFWRTTLMAGVDFVTTSVMANTTQQYTDQYGNASYTHISNTVPISLMSYSIGIGYSF